MPAYKGAVERQPTNAASCTADCTKGWSATWLTKPHVSSAIVLLHHGAWSLIAVGLTVPVAFKPLTWSELWSMDAAFLKSLRPLAEAGAGGEGFLCCRRCARVEKPHCQMKKLQEDVSRLCSIRDGER